MTTAVGSAIAAAQGGEKAQRAVRCQVEDALGLRGERRDVKPLDASSRDWASVCRKVEQRRADRKMVKRVMRERRRNGSGATSDK